MMKSHHSFPAIFFYGLFAATLLMPMAGEAESAKDYSQQMARQSPAWLRDGVIYEIFPRNLSATGNFDGITEKLDELNNLGVTILWLMPIQPSGK